MFKLLTSTDYARTFSNGQGIFVHIFDGPAMEGREFYTVSFPYAGMTFSAEADTPDHLIDVKRAIIKLIDECGPEVVFLDDETFNTLPGKDGQGAFFVSTSYNRFFAL